jgi:hypothetical protein
MDTEKARGIIEKIELRKHSGSGRRAGVEVKVKNVSLKDKKIFADVTVFGPEKDEVREYKEKSYSYDYIFGS